MLSLKPTEKSPSQWIAATPSLESARENSQNAQKSYLKALDQIMVSKELLFEYSKEKISQVLSARNAKYEYFP